MYDFLQSERETVSKLEMPLRKQSRKHTITLLRRNHIFHLKCLLNDCSLESLLLDCDLDLDTTRVGLGPNETSVDDAHFRQAAKTAQTDGEQFLRFGRSDDPAVRGLEPTLTVSAAVKGCLTLDTKPAARLVNRFHWACVGY